MKGRITMNIIDGKAISKQIKDEVKEKVAALKAQGVTVHLRSYRSAMIRLRACMSIIRKRHVLIRAWNQKALSFRKRQHRKNCFL